MYSSPMIPFKLSLTRTELKTLRSLFELGQSDSPISVNALSFCADAPKKTIACALSALHEKELVEATRLRLTLRGLALAVCLPPLSRDGAALAA